MGDFYGAEAARQFFISEGADLVTATRQAYAAVFGMVQQQAAILSFIGIFHLLGWIFLACVPLLLLMKRPTTRRSAPMH